MAEEEVVVVESRARLDKEAPLGISRAEWEQAKQQRQARLASYHGRPFPGVIINSERTEALRTAGREYQVIDLTNKLVFWTDGSVIKPGLHGNAAGRAGVGIVWRSNHALDEWEERSYSLCGEYESNTVEFFAISEALKIALQLCKIARARSTPDEDTRVSCVTVYTDSKYSIQAIGDPNPRGLARSILYGQGIELAKLKECAYELTDMGVVLELRWVKGHRGVEGNVRADMLAGRAARLYKHTTHDYIDATNDTLRHNFRLQSTPTRNLLSITSRQIAERKRLKNMEREAEKVEHLKRKFEVEKVQKHSQTDKLPGHGLLMRFGALLPFKDERRQLR